MKIVQIGCGEYHTTYLHKDGTVAATLWDAAKGKHTYQLYKDPDTGGNLTGITSVVGGQYTSLALDSTGIAYELDVNSQGGPLAKKIQIPSSKISYIMMLNRAKLLLDDIGNLYYLAEDSGRDSFNLGAWVISSTPKLLLSGYGIMCIDVGEPNQGLMFLTVKGEVYTLSYGKTTPVKVIGSGVVDIAMVGRGAFVAITADNDILAWGPLMSYVTGNPAEPATTIPKSIKALWPVKFPIKKIMGNWNTLHILDAYGILWGGGENVCGEVGNGQGCNDWKNYKAADGKTIQPYAWNWLKAQMLQPPIKLPGKWKDFFTHGSMALYCYEIDTLDTLHSHGRDKKRALGSGLSQPDNAYADKYPNWKDVWSPTPVDPSTVEWKYITFDPATAENNFPVNTSFPSDSVVEPDQPKPVPEPIEVYSINVGKLKWSFMDDGEIKFAKQ